MAPHNLPDLDAWRKQARLWLEGNAPPKATDDPDAEEETWGRGSDSVAVFHNLDADEERQLLDDAAAWQRRKLDAGYGAIDWPHALGGAGLPRDYARAFAAEEAAFDTPPSTELVSVTLGLIAPTIAAFGTPAQQAEHIPPLLRLDQFACQLFSEPGAGSDLANLACRAQRDGDEWIIDGQKVWTSGARFAAWGELIARTDPALPKHRGQTAFLVPLDAPGVEVRPIRQMTGGAAFNEVFFTGVRVPDRLRLGAEGEGWKVALTTLGFERGASGGGGAGRVGGSWARALSLARHLGVAGDPLVRQDLAQMWIRSRVLGLIGRRVSSSTASGQPPGPEGSIGKLYWTQNMTAMSDAVGRILGARLTADSGEWGTYAWAEHVLGAPGYRIAGGSDEIQRNLIGERVLGLPAEPRVDKDGPWRAR
ncbi:MAG: acyl-CoA dehydrogenase family protein [Acidimicrobiales bacterium]